MKRAHQFLYQWATKKNGGSPTNIPGEIPSKIPGTLGERSERITAEFSRGIPRDVLGRLPAGIQEASQ